MQRGIKEIIKGFAFSLLSACVTPHNGDVKSVLDDTAAISCAENKHYRTDFNTAITCTFENKKGPWKEFEVANVTPSAGARVLTSEETATFAKAFAQKDESDRHNFNMVAPPLALAGLAIGVVSSNPKVSTVGFGVAVAASAASMGEEVNKDYGGHQHSTPSYGPDHILSGPFQVPSELYLRKSFVVVFAEKSQIPETVTLCFVKPSQACREWKVRSRSADRRRY